MREVVDIPFPIWSSHSVYTPNPAMCTTVMCQFKTKLAKKSREPWSVLWGVCPLASVRFQLCFTRPALWPQISSTWGWGRMERAGWGRSQCWGEWSWAECFPGGPLVRTFLTLHQERSLVGALGDTVHAHCPWQQPYRCARRRNGSSPTKSVVLNLWVANLFCVEIPLHGGRGVA